MMDYFTSNKLFSSQQYGFRPNRSTELAALELMDSNIDSMNQNFSPVNIYADLSKAFDCLDHAILLSKLKYYGLNGNAIKLLKNYLSDRPICATGKFYITVSQHFKWNSPGICNGSSSI